MSPGQFLFLLANIWLAAGTVANGWRRAVCWVIGFACFALARPA